jgi:hypothetical protein
MDERVCEVHAHVSITGCVSEDHDAVLLFMDVAVLSIAVPFEGNADVWWWHALFSLE